MSIHNPLFRTFAWVLAAIVTLGAVYLVVHARYFDAAILFGFVAVAMAIGMWNDRVPALFTLLFGIVAAINAAGYVFNLWQSPWWFDEFVHVITPFALLGAIAWVLIERDMSNPTRNSATYFVKILFLGLLIGFAWEGFEYVVGIVGDQLDTILDLVADGIGSLFGAAFCLWAARAGPDDPEHDGTRRGGNSGARG